MENGEELFYLKDSGATVCSLRVKKLLISNTISNVSAYIHYISTITNTKTLHLEGTNYVFYFKVKNEDVAKGYWMGSSIGAKMLLKIVFKPYPVMKETVSNLDTKEFYKDPISLIRTFDSLLK